MRVAPVSQVHRVNRYTPRKVRDQSEMVEKSQNFAFFMSQERNRQSVDGWERSHGEQR